MKWRCVIVCLSYLVGFSCGRVVSQSVQGQFGASRGWPHPIPCRIGDVATGELFVMTLGDVQTPLAQGVFDPASDEVRLSDRRVLHHYYRDSLKVRFFGPIDKSIFPVPPSGWCSWYYYYQEIDENEVRRNAEWIASNLKDYGAVFVQIDDGWQGRGHGGADNRDWTTTDKRFPRGMGSLAAYIKELGLRPGLWLAPHGQSNSSVVKSHPGVFLMKSKDSSASETWEGKYLVDPTAPEAHDYLRDLFQTLTAWGYEYFKIDGQPIVMEEYGKTKFFMRAPLDDVANMYRHTIETIRTAIGPERYLLGCWGIPLEGVCIMNGSRTGGDVVLGWDGFKVALDATMKYYFLHNVAWYCDPDVMLLRSPLTLDQARAWATLQGLTGQAVMSSDRLMDLSEERVEILKRVFPAADIRPLDLFPSQTSKGVWDLKVNHLGREYDIVGLFNFGEEKTRHRYVAWKDLGIEKDAPVHVFDFWNKEYLGCWEKGMSVDIQPTGCRVLTLLPSSGQIQLVSTSRHMTQGWIDLSALSYDAARRVFTGRSKVIAADPYELRFAFPRGMNFVVSNASAGNLPVRVVNHQGWAAVEFVSSNTTEISWQVSFDPGPQYTFPVKKPDNLAFDVDGLSAVTLRWSSQYYLNAGYQVYLNGDLLGYSASNTFAVQHLDPTRNYTAEVRSVWENGSVSEETASTTINLESLIPAELYLSDVEPVRASAGWGSVETDRAVTGKPLSIHGMRYTKGVGTHAYSDIQYQLFGLFDSLSAYVGVDDGNESGKGSVEFIVLGDGRELWKSRVMRKGDLPKVVNLSLQRVQNLVLRVTDGGDGNDYDHADWGEARLFRAKRP